MKSSVSSRQSAVTSRQLSAATVLLILALFMGVQMAAGEERDGRYAILLVGASGDSDLQTVYLERIRKLHSILRDQFGFPDDQIVVLFDDPELDPELINHKATREEFEKAVLSLSSRVRKDDLVFVYLDGHGSYDGKTYKLLLVGRDPTDWELAGILYSLQSERFVIVNATNCSGGSLPALSAKGKIIITATKSGREQNYTHMGGFFVESLDNNAADSNKDNRLSVIEAFSYASRKVEEFYQSDGRLKTEHAILDDNGDAEGQSDPTPESEDGLLARTTFFDRGASIDSMKILTPEQQKLTLDARELEKRIEALKYDKADMPQAEYEKRLEELLLELARINAKLQK